MSPKRKRPGVLQIKVNKAYCKGCAICAAFCPENVLEMKGDKPVVARLDDCTECLQCEMRCPDFAITVDRFLPVEEE